MHPFSFLSSYKHVFHVEQTLFHIHQPLAHPALQMHINTCTSGSQLQIYPPNTGLDVWHSHPDSTLLLARCEWKWVKSRSFILIFWFLPSLSHFTSLPWSPSHGEHVCNRLETKIRTNLRRVDDNKQSLSIQAQRGLWCHESWQEIMSWVLCPVQYEYQYHLQGQRGVTVGIKRLLMEGLFKKYGTTRLIFLGMKLDCLKEAKPGQKLFWKSLCQWPTSTHPGASRLPIQP